MVMHIMYYNLWGGAERHVTATPTNLIIVGVAGVRYASATEPNDFCRDADPLELAERPPENIQVDQRTWNRVKSWKE